jgi:hypothetical protein
MQEPTPSPVKIREEIWIGGAVFVISFIILLTTRPPFLFSQDTRHDEVKNISWPLLFTASLISACIVTFYN